MKNIKEIKDWEEMINIVVCGDSLAAMKIMPDKCIDLVLTDPPYGIGAGKMTMGRGSRNDTGKNFQSEWDYKTPDQIYFDELIRISKNQIIWGGNYFALVPSRCWLLWDKKDYNSDFASHELAWTSFDKVVKCFRQARNVKGDRKQHPTQKPIELMQWCLENYAKDCKIICDPFAGSFTAASACKNMNFSWIAIEQEKKYCEIGEKRLEQEVLFS